jgi:hypothetical protein
VLATGDGALFPSPTGIEWFPLTLQSSAAIEILKATARSGDSITVERAQEGTTAMAFSAGDRAELRFTAGVHETYAQVSELLTASGTGVLASYVASVVEGGTTFNVPAIEGEISGDQGYFRISYAGTTGVEIDNVSGTSTYVYLDKDGDLQQQTTAPTREDLIRKIFLMRVEVVDATSSTPLFFFEFSSGQTAGDGTPFNVTFDASGIATFNAAA